MPKKKTELSKPQNDYNTILSDLSELLEQSRRLKSRSVNAIMTATYWEIGRRIVEVEQKGEQRAEYGEKLLERLAEDLTNRFGRSFSLRNLRSFRAFYSTWQIRQTVSAEFEKSQTLSGKSSEIGQTASAQSLNLTEIAKYFPLPWSHYVELLSCRDENERKFYESESLRGGWSVRQLKRQKNSQFYKRTLLSKNKVAMLKKGEKAEKEDYVSPDEEIKDPFVLEFLNLKDEYSELELEDAIIKHLQSFLLEMGAGFAFIVGRCVCASAMNGFALTLFYLIVV